MQMLLEEEVVSIMLIQNLVSASALCQINSCQENLLKIVLFILLEIERNGEHFLCFWGRGGGFELLRWGLRVLDMPCTSDGDACYTPIEGIPYSRTWL